MMQLPLPQIADSRKLHQYPLSPSPNNISYQDYQRQHQQQQQHTINQQANGSTSPANRSPPPSSVRPLRNHRPPSYIRLHQQPNIHQVKGTLCRLMKCRPRPDQVALDYDETRLGEPAAQLAASEQAEEEVEQESV